MYSIGCDVDVDCELSLNDIHQSIEATITSIREKHEQVDSIFGDLPHLQRVVANVLEPINQRTGLEKVASIANLKTLLARCPRSSPPNSAGRKGRVPTPPTKLKPMVPRAMSDGRIELDKGKTVSLPPIKQKCFSATQRRSPGPGNAENFSEVIVLPINISRTCRTVLHTTENQPRTQLITARRERLLRRQNEIRDESNGPPDIKHFEMSRFLADFEREICVLQETFSTFTQRGLVPLQTFCKQCNNSTHSAWKERENDPADDTKPKISASKESLDKTEFRIVQTMNQIRQLLWPSDNTGLPEHLFCDDHFSRKVSEEIDCKKYPIIRLIPDVLQKFNEVLTLGAMWLKRDVLYVQNAKSALQRAHRRFLKTERLWRQARDSQRQLRTEWENLLGDLQSNSARLNAVDEDIMNLKRQIDKSRKMKNVLEEKLRSTEENVEPLVAKHKAVRKRVIVLSTKIEARERSHGFLESRVLSLKADQEAISEKLRISEDYANNLQNKMEELYGVRDAWSRRYEEKTDPDRLRARLQHSRIRMPLPSLREKTFILRTGMENLRRALDLVEKRLSNNEVHWSKLCEKLPWPGDAHPRSPSLPPIHNPNGLSNSNQEPNSPDSGSSISRIKERVLSARPSDEKQQRSLMLQLWLQENGKEATLEKLLGALRASDIPSVADSVERHIT